MLHSQKITVFIFVLVLTFMFILTSCNSKQSGFPKISKWDDAEALVKTGYLRNGILADPYPECDLTQIKMLPCYKYNDEQDILRKRITEFANLFSLDISQWDENFNSGDNHMRYSISDNMVEKSIYASGCSVGISVTVPYTDGAEMLDTPLGSFCATPNYVESNGSLVLSEELAKSYSANAEILLDKLRRKYILHKVDSEKYNSSFGNNEFPENIKTTFCYCTEPQTNEAESVLLHYYGLDNCVRFQTSYYNGKFNATLNMSDTDYMSEVGNYKIIAYSEAKCEFDDDDNVTYCQFSETDSELRQSDNAETVRNYDLYLVYVQDNSGYIRPIYMKQDYYSVGNLFGAAWIDAIKY